MTRTSSNTPKRVTAAPNTLKVGQRLRFTIPITVRPSGDMTVTIRRGNTGTVADPIYKPKRRRK